MYNNEVRYSKLIYIFLIGCSLNAPCEKNNDMKCKNLLQTSEFADKISCEQQNYCVDEYVAPSAMGDEDVLDCIILIEKVTEKKNIIDYGFLYLIDIKDLKEIKLLLRNHNALDNEQLNLLLQEKIFNVLKSHYFLPTFIDSVMKQMSNKNNN